MRFFLITLSLVLLLALPGCKKREPEHARVDAALAPLLPPDTVALACVRLDRLKGTAFYTRYVEGRRIPALEQFGRATGLDPRESVWELVFSTNGRTSYVFIRGKFGGEFGVEPEFKDTGLARADYKGHYLIYRGGSGVVFLNTGAAVAGRVDDLKALVDGFDAPSRATPQALLDLSATLPGTAQIWAAGTRPDALLQLVLPSGAPSGSAPAGAGGMSANFARLGRRISRLTLWGDLSQGLQLHATALAGSPEDAAELRDTLRAGLELGRAAAPDARPEIARLYGGISAVADGATLRMEVNEPAELLDTLLGALLPARGE